MRNRRRSVRMGRPKMRHSRVCRVETLERRDLLAAASVWWTAAVGQDVGEQNWLSLGGAVPEGEARVHTTALPVGDPSFELLRKVVVPDWLDMDHVRYQQMYQHKLAQLDEKIGAYLETFEDRSDGPELAALPRNRALEPQLNLRDSMHKLTGVDLTDVDGIGGQAALQIISEIGMDMSKWQTDKHFVLVVFVSGVATDGRQPEEQAEPHATE